MLSLLNMTASDIINLVDILQEEKIQQVNHLFEEIDDRRMVSEEQIEH